MKSGNVNSPLVNLQKMTTTIKKKTFHLFILFFLTPYMLSAIEKPDFSHTRDFYDTTFNLQLTSTVENSIIRYKLDGTKPNQLNGIDYNEPIPISKTTAVRAITVVNDSVSKVRTHTFIFLDDVIHQDNSGIPLVLEASSLHKRSGLEMSFLIKTSINLF